MAIPAGVILGAKIATAVAPSAISAIQTGNLNKKNRKFAVEQADKARAQALADFDATNAYNLPVNEKKRLIAAGLNPAMMYGGGPAQTPSTIVRGTAPAQTTAQAASVEGLSNILPMLTQLKLVSAQTEGIQLDNAAKYQDIVNKAESKNEVGNPEILKSQLVQTQLQNAIIDMDIKKSTSAAEIKIKLNDALQSALKTSELAFRNQNLLPLEKQKAEQDLEMLKIAIQQGQSTATIARMNAELAEMGIYPTDPVYLRQAIVLLNRYNN